MKYAAAVLGSLALIVLGVLLVVPPLVDWNRYKPEITAAFYAYTGHRLAIDGAVELQLLPSPRLTVADARLAGSGRPGDPDPVRIEAIQAHIAFFPLLSGVVQLRSLSVVRPTVTVRRRSTAARDWMSAFAGKRPPPDAAAGGTAARRDSPVRIDSVNIVNGAIILDDAANQRSHRIERWNARLSAESPDGPFALEATALIRGLELSVAGHLADIGGERPAPASLRLELPDERGNFVFIGAVDLAQGPRLSGEAVIEAENFYRFSETIAVMVGGDSSRFATLARPLQIRSEVSATPQSAQFGNLEIQVGGMRLTGVAQTEFSDQTVITADVALGHLDLDAFAVPDVQAAVTAPVATLLALPDDMTAFLSLSADAVSLRNDAVRQLNFEATLDRGVLAVDALSAILPGGTTARLAGTLQADRRALRFIGHAEGGSDNLRTVLTWWGLPLPALPPDRLRKAVFDADVDVSATHLHLRRWNMEIDATKLSGALQVGFEARPMIGLDIAADTVNLDAYLQPSSGPADGPAAETRSPDGVLAELASAIDADIRVRIDEALYRDTVLHGIDLDLLMQSGQIELRDVSVDDLAGAAMSVSGTLAGPVTDPSGDVEVVVDAQSAARLVRLAGFEVTETIKTLGHVLLTCRLRGRLDEVTLDGRLDALGGVVEFQGLVGTGSDPPGLDLTVAARHPQAGVLAATLFGAEAWQDIRLGAGVLSASAVSRPDDGIDVDATLIVADGRLHVAGVLQPGAGPAALQASLGFDHPDIKALLQRIAPDFDPGGDGPGAVTLSLMLEGRGGRAIMRDMTMSLGPTRLSGEARLDLNGPKPKIVLAARTDLFNLAAWLPEASGSGVPLWPVDRQWSREAIDLAPLQEIELEFDFAADRLLYPTGVITDLTAEADIVGGRLTLGQLRGTLLGGTLSATGALSSGSEPHLALDLDIDDAVISGSGIGRAPLSGVLDYEVRLTSRGRSEFAIVSALQGEGRFELADGSLDGIDLPAFGALLRRPDSIDGSLARADKVMESGMTPFDSLSGRYGIVDGTLRSDDVRIEAPEATGVMSVAINLLEHELNARSRLRLTDHPEAPPIGLSHAGPLSDLRWSVDVAALQRWLRQRAGQASRGLPVGEAPDGRNIREPALRGRRETLVQ